MKSENQKLIIYETKWLSYFFTHPKSNNLVCMEVETR